jgi:dephospho-CoA kinase
MKWIGLTGGIASGKTTVANLLKSHGIPVIDADQLAHQALRFHKDKIITYFGPDVIDDKGELDRRKLAEKVFANKKLKKTLESIIHPFVQEKMQKTKQLLEASGHKLAVYDVPLLFENNLLDQFDEVIVVYVPESLSLSRLMARNNLTEEEAAKRISNQLNIEDKKAKAHIVFDNQGDQDALVEQVNQWLAQQNL